jgi:hypothetical protein
MPIETNVFALCFKNCMMNTSVGLKLVTSSICDRFNNYKLHIATPKIKGAFILLVTHNPTQSYNWQAFNNYLQMNTATGSIHSRKSSDSLLIWNWRRNTLQKAVYTTTTNSS